MNTAGHGLQAARAVGLPQAEDQAAPTVACCQAGEGWQAAERDRSEVLHDSWSGGSEEAALLMLLPAKLSCLAPPCLFGSMGSNTPSILVVCETPCYAAVAPEMAVAGF